MAMPGRTYEAETPYRYGFNGKETSPEISNGAVSFEARIYDARIGRFFSTDPRESEYAWQSTYVYFKNCPTSVLDVLGMGDGPEPTKPIGKGKVQGERRHGEMKFPNSDGKEEIVKVLFAWDEKANKGVGDWVRANDATSATAVVYATPPLPRFYTTQWFGGQTWSVDRYFKRHSDKYLTRRMIGSPVLNDGDSELYKESVSMYSKQFDDLFQANQEYRANSIGGVTAIFAPAAALGIWEVGAVSVMQQATRWTIQRVGINKTQEELTSGALNGLADMTSQIQNGVNPWDKEYNWGSTIGNVFLRNAIASGFTGALYEKKVLKSDKNFMINWGAGSLGNAFGNIPMIKKGKNPILELPLNNFTMPLIGNHIGNKINDAFNK